MEQAPANTPPLVATVYPEGMLDGTLIDTLERLSPSEQEAILTIAEYIEQKRASAGTVESLLAELREPRFPTPDEALAPARDAAARPVAAAVRPCPLGWRPLEPAVRRSPPDIFHLQLPLASATIRTWKKRSPATPKSCMGRPCSTAPGFPYRRYSTTWKAATPSTIFSKGSRP